MGSRYASPFALVCLKLHISDYFICILFVYNDDSLTRCIIPGTYSNTTGARQPSQLELDVAKHQATCVACLGSGRVKS
jgi:hypothetical protein